MFQGFGANPTTTSPFAQTFGKPTPSTFSAPAFGSSGSTLFGQSTTQPTSLFGSTTPAPPFGQTQTTQPSFGGGFTNTGSTGLFGSQQNASTSGGTGLFGSSGSSAFGQTKPASFGFSGQTGTTGLFGQQAQTQQPQTQTPSLFGQTPAAGGTSIFGSTAGGFGATAAGGGTTIKFTPVTGSDTMVKSGTTQTISTRHHCITCMKEYDSKSLEELRLEDYAANRKGPQQGVQPASGLFGATPQPSLFGAAASTNPTSGSLFGSGGFGSTGAVFGSAGSSLFGKPGTTQATGFGTTPTTNTTSTFGFNAGTTANNPFGANTAQVKPFGAAAPQTAGGLFGTGTSQPSNVFGTQSTSFSSFGSQANQGIGLFNQNKPPFQLGGTQTPGFSFGQPAGAPANTAAPTNLFGAKPGGTGFGASTFGQPAASTATGFGSLTFGQNNQNQSLFGSFNKPATTGFSFGQNNTAATTTLGTGLNLGGNNLFGNTAAKPGGLFGTNTGGGLFGSSTFGSTGGTTFGSTPNTGLGGTSLSLGGSSLLGGTAPPNQNMNPLNQHILALASMPFGDLSLFKNLLPITGKTDELLKPTSPAAQKALMNGQNFKVSPRTGSKIKVKPIGSSNLTKKSLFDGLDDEENNNAWQVKPSPKRLVLKNKPFGDVSGSGRHLQGVNGNNDEEEATVLNLGSTPRYIKSRTQDSQTTSPANTSDKQDKESVTSPSNHPLSPCSDKIDISSPGQQRGLPSSEQKSVEETSWSEKSVNDFTQAQSQNSENKENVEHSSSSTSDSELDESLNPDIEQQPPHPTGIKLRRVGYYTIPPLNDLAGLMDSEGRCIVDNFTVGRLNYGNVFYPDSFDVAGLNLDEIVHIRHKEVVVYPDDSVKPPVGSGLNRRAQVTLDRVWPIDKTTRAPISDPEGLSTLDYEGKLRKASAKNKTRFVEYRPQTGSWVFKVDHFSKYGLSDSDEDESPVPSDVKKLKLSSTTSQFPPQSKEKQKTRRGLDMADLPPQQMTNGVHQKAMVLDEDDQDMCDLGDGPLKSLFDASEELDLSHKSPTARLANDLGTSSHKVQLMKQSFYHDDDNYNFNDDFMAMADYRTEEILDVDVDEYEHDVLLREKSKLSHSLSLFRSHFGGPCYDGAPPSPAQSAHPSILGLPTPPTLSKGRITSKPGGTHSPILSGPPPPLVVPQSLVLKQIHRVVPWEMSSAKNLNACCLADLSLTMGRRFKVGWAPSCSLVTMTTQHLSLATPLSSDFFDLGSLLSQRAEDDFSPFIIQRLRLKGGLPEDVTSDFQESIEEHMEIVLNHSLAGEEEGCPVFAPVAGNDALHAHCRVNNMDPSVESTWELCAALWGDLPDCIDADEGSHLKLMERKKAISLWLESCANAAVKDDLMQNGSDSPEIIFTLLTAHQIFEACKKSQDNKDHYTSLLLSQVGCSAAVRTLAEKQLAQWIETQADSLIDRDRIKLIMLVAGLPVLQASDSVVNICENLDWKRAFALHLWYVCSQSSSVTDALLKYEAAFEGEDGYAAQPLPAHSSEWESTAGQSVFDVCYHLLRLYSFRSHPLEKLLNPATHTSDPLDYRLSWLLMQVLESLGYSHLSELSAAQIHTAFAAQLESHGMWHWAVFVLLHLQNSARRQTAVQDLIGRHVTLARKDSLSPEERFLLEKLNVPKQWLFQAKATLAKSYSRHEDGAIFLLEAEEWNKGHEVIMQHIAAKAIINEKYEYMENLLTELAGESKERGKIISGWDHQGALIWDYLLVLKEVDAVLSTRNPYTLEKLQPQLGSLCCRIVKLPTPTSIHRLCQTEIIKRTAQLIYSLLVLQRKDGDFDSVSRLAHLITQLPLPEDYAHQEMHQVSSSWLDTRLL